MKPFRHVAEYALLRVGLALLDRMPMPACERLACVIADVAYRLASSRRRIARENLLRSGIASTPAEATRLARASFRHFATLVVESLRSGEFFNENNWRDRVEIDIPPATLELLQAPGRGIILASGHFGNWEIAAQLLSFIKPVVGLTRGFNNPESDRLMQARKPRNRFRLEPKHSTDTSRLLTVLKQGDILALMMDQHARDRGMVINFLGQPASTHTSAALLHLITGAPLVFGTCARTGMMRYKLTATEPLVAPKTGNKETDLRWILEALTRHLETAIRAYPEQYLWGHRRWRITTGSPAGIQGEANRQP